MKANRLSFVIIGLIVLALACTGEKQASDDVQTADYLVAAVDSVGLQRTSEVQVFVGDSLWEYINGGAELYHTYNFLDVVTAYYTQEGTEILVDIYQFDTPEHAFGLYSMLRDETSQPVELGIEGFGSPTNLVFVKGVYVVMVTGFEQTDAVATAVNKVGTIFAQRVPGSTDVPKDFALFPSANALARTNKIHRESFLSQSFLRDVYVQRHVVGADTVTLFLTDDKAGAKYIEWREASQGQQVPGVPYDDGMSLRIANSYYGDIVAGLRSGKLIGIIGYKDDFREFLNGWLESLPISAP